MANAILLNQSTEVTQNNILGALSNDLLINIESNPNENQLTITKLLENGNTETKTISFSDWGNWVRSLGFATEVIRSNEDKKLQDNIDNLQNQLGALSNTVENKATQTDLNALSGRVSALNTNMNELSTNVTNLSSNITSLSNSIDTLKEAAVFIGEDNDLNYESVQG